MRKRRPLWHKTISAYDMTTRNMRYKRRHRWYDRHEKPYPYDIGNIKKLRRASDGKM
jgi:hypothetical protein